MKRKNHLTRELNEFSVNQKGYHMKQQRRDSFGESREGDIESVCCENRNVVKMESAGQKKKPDKY